MTLELTSSRDLCTARTLTELSWVITGGKPPYTLTIEGETVDAEAESHRVNCGPLLMDPQTEEPLPNQTKTFSATVMDSQLTPGSSTNALQVILATALAAPTSVTRVTPLRTSASIAWPGLRHPSTCLVGNGCFGFRTRNEGDTGWEYREDREVGIGDDVVWVSRRGLESGETFEASVAALRHPLDLETPNVLNWSVTARATTLTDITGFVATATHDTVTVRWNRQTSAAFWHVALSPSTGANRGARSQDIERWDSGSWGDAASGVHEVVFRHLPSDTEYVVAVVSSAPVESPQERVTVGSTVRTKPAPLGQQEREYGPQNLRATSTRNSIMVSWDHPYVGNKADYWLWIEGPPGSVPNVHRNASVFPPLSSYTYTGLDPNTTYRIEVMHNDVFRNRAAITITTNALPAAGSAETSAGQRSAVTSSPVQTWPLTGPFAPVWPVPAYLSDPER